MRILYPLTIIYIGFALSSCATPSCSENCKSINTPIHTVCTHKNPLTISFYSKNAHPKQPYKVIGEENISRFNMGGIKRQEANLRDAMRELAAAMGGDAVIDIKHDSKSISGTVVAYEKNKDVVPQNG